MLKSVLITGGSGFLGRGLTRELLKRGAARIAVFSRDEAKHARMRGEIEDERVRYLVGDVRDQQRLARACEGVDVVIHAAALKRVEVAEYCPEEVVKTNVQGTLNVIEAARGQRVGRVLLVSTDKAVSPANVYGATKLLAERMVLAANNQRRPGDTCFSVVRYGNVAGSTGSVIPVWRRCLEQGQVARLTLPEATRYYMTLEQAVALVLDTAHGMRGGELAIPDLPAYRLADLAAAMGVQYTVTGLGPGEKVHESMREGETSAVARRMTVEELRQALTLPPGAITPD